MCLILKMQTYCSIATTSMALNIALYIVNIYLYSCDFLSDDEDEHAHDQFSTRVDVPKSIRALMLTVNRCGKRLDGYLKNNYLRTVEEIPTDKMNWGFTGLQNVSPTYKVKYT